VSETSSRLGLRCLAAMISMVTPPEAGQSVKSCFPYVRRSVQAAELDSQWGSEPSEIIYTSSFSLVRGGGQGAGSNRRPSDFSSKST
jgi:hypothetical protein